MLKDRFPVIGECLVAEKALERADDMVRELEGKQVWLDRASDVLSELSAMKSTAFFLLGKGDLTDFIDEQWHRVQDTRIKFITAVPK
jgi:hypothetical protein